MSIKTVLIGAFEEMLCCPLCKTGLQRCSDDYLCLDCDTRYPKRNGVPDFRIIGPAYARSLAQTKWIEGQKGFEQFSAEIVRRDSAEFYSAEINSVIEIYTRDFPPFYGTLLDVGGSRGTLRHFLASGVKYLVIDPQIDAFEGLGSHPNLLRTYPFMAEPCSFLAGFAEQLPLFSRTFDFVHMRSVLDHVFDPQLAIKEAYRVLKDNGKLMIGVSTHISQPSGNALGPGIVRALGRARVALRNGGVPELVTRIQRKLTSQPDHHMWRWSKDDLVNLVEHNGFDIDKLVWQKPPFQNCIYMLCRKGLR